MQWAHCQTKLSLQNTHFTYNGHASKHNYHCKTPISHAMGLPANKILPVKTFKTPISHANWPIGKQNSHYKTPISHAMGLSANKSLTINLLKHTFHVQWACRQTKFLL